MDEQYPKAELPQKVKDAIERLLKDRPDLPKWFDFPVVKSTGRPFTEEDVKAATEDEV